LDDGVVDLASDILVDNHKQAKGDLGLSSQIATPEGMVTQSVDVVLSEGSNPMDTRPTGKGSSQNKADSQPLKEDPQGTMVALQIATSILNSPEKLIMPELHKNLEWIHVKSKTYAK